MSKETEIPDLPTEITPQSQDLFAQRSPQKILALNGWLDDYCAANGQTYLDYFDAMVDEHGFLRR